MRAPQRFCGERRESRRGFPGAWRRQGSSRGRKARIGICMAGGVEACHSAFPTPIGCALTPHFNFIAPLTRAAAAVARLEATNHMSSSPTCNNRVETSRHRLREPRLRKSGVLPEAGRDQWTRGDVNKERCNQLRAKSAVANRRPYDTVHPPVRPPQPRETCCDTSSLEDPQRLQACLQQPSAPTHRRHLLVRRPRREPASTCQTRPRASKPAQPKSVSVPQKAASVMWLWKAARRENAKASAKLTGTTGRRCRKREVPNPKDNRAECGGLLAYMCMVEIDVDTPHLHNIATVCPHYNNYTIWHVIPHTHTVLRPSDDATMSDTAGLRGSLEECREQTACGANRARRRPRDGGNTTPRLRISPARLAEIS